MTNPWENTFANKNQTEDKKEVIKIDDIANYFHEEAEKIIDNKSSDRSDLKIADEYKEMANEIYNGNCNKALGEIERTIYAVKTYPETFPEQSIEKLRNFASFLTAEVYKNKEKKDTPVTEVESERMNPDYVENQIAGIQRDIEGDGKTSYERELELEKLRNLREFFKGTKDASK